MSVEYICDGCGKREPAANMPHGFFKPARWFERGDEHGTQVACSRECIAKIAQKTGKTAVVAPF